MVKAQSLAALLLAAAASVGTSAQATGKYSSFFQCGAKNGSPCCTFTSPKCTIGSLTCKRGICVACGTQDAPICDGPNPCSEGFVQEGYICVKDDGCGSLDELCCAGVASLFCDQDLVCDTNVQALVGPGICRNCGAVDELPCSEGSCDKGLENVDGVCIDPTAPPPPPCGGPGEPCCTGVNIPFDASGCDPSNLCAFTEDSPTGVCEPCGAVGEQCCIVQNDDVVTLECTAEQSECGEEDICVSTAPPPCGADGEPCCSDKQLDKQDLGCDDELICGEDDVCEPCGKAGEPCCESLSGDIVDIFCEGGLVCNKSFCEFEAVVEGQAPVEEPELVEPEPEKGGDGEREVDEDVQKEVVTAGDKPAGAPKPAPVPGQKTEETGDRTETTGEDGSVTVTETKTVEASTGGGEEEPEPVTEQEEPAEKAPAPEPEQEEPEEKAPTPEPEQEEPAEKAPAPKEPTGNPVDEDIQRGSATAGNRPADRPPADTSNQETVRKEEESDSGGTKTATVKVTGTSS